MAPPAQSEQVAVSDTDGWETPSSRFSVQFQVRIPCLTGQGGEGHDWRLAKLGLRTGLLLKFGISLDLGSGRLSVVEV